MTTAVKEKKPFLPQRKPQVSAGGGAVAVNSGGAGRPMLSSAALTIGGEPRVHLLPLEVQQRKGVRLIKRRLLGIGVVVVAVVAAAYGLVTFELTAAQGQLDAAHTATSTLLVQQAKYGAVTKIQTDIASIKNSESTSTAQEILWAPYLQSLESTLPSGASVTAVSAAIDNPFGAATTTANGSPTDPLQGPHIATVQLTVSIIQADIPNWLNTLPNIKGWVDDTPGSVTAPSGGGAYYSLVVVMHLNTDAVSNRFTKASTTK